MYRILYIYCMIYRPSLPVTEIISVENSISVVETDVLFTDEENCPVSLDWLLVVILNIVDTEAWIDDEVGTWGVGEMPIEAAEEESWGEEEEEEDLCMFVRAVVLILAQLVKGLDWEGLKFVAECACTAVDPWDVVVAVVGVE